MTHASIPSLKDTGIPWLGQVPEEWTVQPIKHGSYIKARVGWKGLTSDEFEASAYAYLVTGTDFRGQFIDWTSCYQVNEERYLDDPFIQLRDGDLLITKDGTIGKLSLVSGLDKPASLNSGIFLVRAQESYSTRFLYWVLSSRVFEDYVALTSTGSTILHLYQNVFEQFSFGFPSLAVQTSIANFLDRETGQIDVLIAKQERLIGLLAEKRQAVITHAVTKGLDPTAPTKPSGVPWLGEIPSHWGAVPLKWLSRFTTGITPPTDNESNFPGEATPYPWIRPEDLDQSGRPTTASKFLSFEAWNGCRPVRADSVLVCCIGATLGKVGLIRKPAVTNQQITAIESEMAGSYLFAALGAARQEIEAMSVGNTLPILNAGRLGMLSVPVPPAQEQLRIAQYVDARSRELDRLSAKCKSAITLLRERRSALISAAVTGKIDVREGVA